MSQGREEQVIERWIHEKVDSINLDVGFFSGKTKIARWTEQTFLDFFTWMIKKQMDLQPLSNNRKNYILDTKSKN